VPIEAVRLIDDGQGSYRVLLKLEPIQGIENMAISQAYIAIDSDRRSRLTSPIVLQVHPITRDWTPGTVSWTAGWTRPGGDFHDEIYARTAVDPSQLGSEVRMDVESVFREMRYGTRFYGLILTVAPYRGIGLRSAETQALPGLSAPRLVVEYATLPRERLPAWVR